MRNAFLFLLTIYPLFFLNAQPPDPQKLAKFGEKIDYQVRIEKFETEDSIYQIVRTSSRDESLRLFVNDVAFMSGRGGQADNFLQYGFYRVGGKRVALPRGEYFFAFQNEKVFTENYRETQSGTYRFVNLKRYGFINQRLKQEASRYDTLSSQMSPKWYYWDGKYILSPQAKDIFIQDSSFFMVRKSDHPRDILLWYIDGQAGTTTLNKLVRLGEKMWASDFQAEAFGLEEVYSSRQHCVVHSLYQQPDKPLGHLFSVFDQLGNLLWETNQGQMILRASHPREELFILHDHPLLFQQLRCVDLPTGQVKWESSLYEIYNNDPKFEFSVLRQEEIEIADMYPVGNSELIAVIMQRQQGDALRGSDPVLFLINRLGQMVFRYEIPRAAQHYRIQEQGDAFSLLTERETYLFRRK